MNYNITYLKKHGIIKFILYRIWLKIDDLRGKKGKKLAKFQDRIQAVLMKEYYENEDNDLYYYPEDFVDEDY